MLALVTDRFMVFLLCGRPRWGYLVVLVVTSPPAVCFTVFRDQAQIRTVINYLAVSSRMWYQQYRVPGAMLAYIGIAGAMRGRVDIDQKLALETEDTNR